MSVTSESPGKCGKELYVVQQGPRIDLGEDAIAAPYRQANGKKGPGSKWLWAGLLVGAILIVGAVVGWRNSTQGSGEAARPHDAVADGLRLAPKQAAKSTSTPLVEPLQSKRATVKRAITGDDGSRLWVSPTHGDPLDLHYLPAGTQLLAHFRPQLLGNHPESEKIIAALGAWGERLLADFQRWYPGPFREVPAMTLGVRADVQGKLHNVLRVELASAWTWRMLQDRMTRYEKGKCEPRHHQGQTFFVAAGLAYWLPADASGSTLVIGLPVDMPELMENGQQPRGLPRDVQRLVASTDRQRIFTALLLVKFLQGAGRKLLEGDSEGTPELPAALAWLLGEDATAAGLSLHWDQDFFIELLAVATLNVRPHQYARQLGERIAELPERIQRTLHGLTLEPYGRQVLARLPAMLRQLKIYTRRGSEQGHAVLRGYLPVRAGHNLLLAGNLLLAAPSSEEHQVANLAVDRAATIRKGATLKEKLASITSLVLPKETLEQSLQLLAEDIGVKIEIVGRDLQMAGITKNQSFGIDLRDQPAKKILLEILRRANPDRTATGAADPRQMLVYIIRPGEDGASRILVTTRTAAAARGETLPAVFRPKPQ